MCYGMDLSPTRCDERRVVVQCFPSYDGHYVQDKFCCISFTFDYNVQETRSDIVSLFYTVLTTF